jgi:prevent-host-death family protein
MARIVTADDLRAKLGRELDALRESEEALYVTKQGRLAGVLLDPEHYAELVERLELSRGQPRCLTGTRRARRRSIVV